ncbi:MAG TPA: general secretion pathway protein GspF [Gammaproteobacteria bacterium]|nr:general secretion pathway protein GspF [Gammaproteobacteria bacterium]
MARRGKPLHPDAPLLHGDHPRPRSRRDFIRLGLAAGTATVFGPSLFSLFARPREAYAALAPDVLNLVNPATCNIATQGAGKIPFICFDLAGGANIAGSNVLVGGQGGQLDFLSTAGYSKLGIPGDQIPPLVNPQTAGNDFINRDLGLAFHSDSAFLRGILEKVSTGTAANINGAIIPARSDNDTGNNPHNPMYGIHRCGADGELLTLIGSRASDSGGNSMAPADLIDLTVRPTKIDRPSDVTGLVDTGKLVGLLNQEDAVAVMEAIARISDKKLGKVSTGLSELDPERGITRDEVVKELVRCGYVKSADLVDRYGDPTTLNPDIDPQIVGPGGIFTQEEYDGDSEFRKTASVMKLVVGGFAGAGTITIGGYDYHTGDRATGEVRDLRAGRCMGACLEYAARLGVPLMLYVFSDGSVASNGTVDDSVDGRGKGVWTGDNSSTAASFFLVYNPGGRSELYTGDNLGPERHQQLGYFRADGSVETAARPPANNVNLLVETVVLNYLALHGEQGQFATLFPGHGLGSVASRDSLIAFNPVVNGTL